MHHQSPCQVSCRSFNPIYGHFSISQDNGRSPHLEFVLREIRPPTKSMVVFVTVQNLVGIGALVSNWVLPRPPSSSDRAQMLHASSLRGIVLRFKFHQNQLSSFRDVGSKSPLSITLAVGQKHLNIFANTTALMPYR